MYKVGCQFNLNADTRYPSSTLTYSTALNDHDMRSHWYIEESPHTDRNWIRNRLTDEALHIESQNGNIQISSLKTNFTSYRWKFPPDSTFFRIQSAWQSNQYLSVEDNTTDVVGYDGLVSSWYSLRFEIEPVTQGATLPYP